MNQDANSDSDSTISDTSDVCLCACGRPSDAMDMISCANYDCEFTACRTCDEEDSIFELCAACENNHFCPSCAQDPDCMRPCDAEFMENQPCPRLVCTNDEDCISDKECSACHQSFCFECKLQFALECKQCERSFTCWRNTCYDDVFRECCACGFALCRHCWDNNQGLDICKDCQVTCSKCQHVVARSAYDTETKSCMTCITPLRVAVLGLMELHIGTPSQKQGQVPSSQNPQDPDYDVEM